MRSRLRGTIHFVKKCVPSRSKHMFLNWWWRDPSPYHLSSNRSKSDFVSVREHANNNSYVDSCGRGCCTARGHIWPGWPRMLYRTRELMCPNRATQQTRHRHIYIHICWHNMALLQTCLASTLPQRLKAIPKCMVSLTKDICSSRLPQGASDSEATGIAQPRHSNVVLGLI